LHRNSYFRRIISYLNCECCILLIRPADCRLDSDRVCSAIPGTCRGDPKDVICKGEDSVRNCLGGTAALGEGCCGYYASSIVLQVLIQINGMSCNAVQSSEFGDRLGPDWLSHSQREGSSSCKP
jgi:hypothetical protein